MYGDPGDGFFTQGRAPVPPAGPTAGPGAGTGAGPATPVSTTRPERSPILGILACMLVATGLGVTMRGGNQGGLVGMPILLLGAGLGAVAWSRGFGTTWGKVAALSLPALTGFAVVTEIIL